MATEFQNKVYRLLKRIPRGKVTTYKHIAHALKCKAYRAVGMACNKNPFAPKVPCHRIISSSGNISGFKGKKSGKAIKEKISLLEKEGIKVKNNKIDLSKYLYKFK